MLSDKKLTFIATAAFGLEGVVKRELQKLGFEDAKAELGGVRFTATLTDGVRSSEIEGSSYNAGQMLRAGGIRTRRGFSFSHSHRLTCL